MVYLFIYSLRSKNFMWTTFTYYLSRFICIRICVKTVYNITVFTIMTCVIIMIYNINWFWCSLCIIFCKPRDWISTALPILANKSTVLTTFLALFNNFWRKKSNRDFYSVFIHFLFFLNFFNIHVYIFETLMRFTPNLST